MVGALGRPYAAMQGESLVRALLRFRSGVVAVLDGIMKDAPFVPEPMFRIDRGRAARSPSSARAASVLWTAQHPDGDADRRRGRLPALLPGTSSPTSPPRCSTARPLAAGAEVARRRAARGAGALPLGGDAPLGEGVGVSAARPLRLLRHARAGDRRHRAASATASRAPSPTRARAVTITGRTPGRERLRRGSVRPRLPHARRARTRRRSTRSPARSTALDVLVNNAGANLPGGTQRVRARRLRAVGAHQSVRCVSHGGRVPRQAGGEHARRRRQRASTSRRWRRTSGSGAGAGLRCGQGRHRADDQDPGRGVGEGRHPRERRRARPDPHPT